MTKIKKLNLTIEEGLHSKLKMKAIEENIPLYLLVIRLLEEGVNQ